MPETKNLIIILADELRTDVALHYGRYPFVKTPHLDHLRAEGVTLHNSFCQYPVCGPSRASIMTGTYPQQNGVMDNISLLPDTARTIGHHLGDLGYIVEAFGKTHGMNPGFRALPEPDALQSLGTTNMGYKAPSDEITGVFEGSKDDHYDAIVARQASEALTRHSERNERFTMFVGLHAPHPPLYPPREYAGMYDADVTTLPETSDDPEPAKPAMQRKLAEERWLYHPTEVRRQMIVSYMDQVSFVDECLGRIMHTLEATGLLDDTLVVFTSDHGDMLGEHNLIGKFNNFYESAIRAPVVMRLPGADHAKRELHSLVEMVDLYPTICELISVPAPSTLAGRSFVPSIHDETQAHRSYVTCTMHGGQMVRTEDWKLAYYADDRPELYYLPDDPDEKRNRFEDPACASIRQELMGYLAAQLIRYHRPPTHAGLNQYKA